MKGFSDFLYFWCTISCIVCLLQVIQSFPFLPGLKEVPRRLKKFIDWNKVLSNTSCVVRGEDARTRIGSDVCKKTIDQRVYAIKKAYRNSANKISLSGNVYSDEKWAPTKTKSFGGKIVHRKKSLRFWIVSSVEQKIYKSFGEKNLTLCRFFSPIKSHVYILY